MQLGTIVVARTGIGGTDLGPDRVLMDLRAGLYHGLNAVAKRIWTLLQEPLSVGELRDAILSEYDVDEETCTADVLALLEDLQRADLIEVQPGADPA